MSDSEVEWQWPETLDRAMWSSGASHSDPSKDSTTPTSILSRHDEFFRSALSSTTLRREVSENGGPLDPVVREVSKRFVGLIPGIGTHGCPQPDSRRGLEECSPVIAGVSGHAAQGPFLKEVLLVVKDRNITQVDARDGQRPPSIERRQRRWDERADRGKEYGGVEAFRWCVARVHGARRAERQRQRTRLE